MCLLPLESSLVGEHVNDMLRGTAKQMKELHCFGSSQYGQNTSEPSWEPFSLEAVLREHSQEKLNGLHFGKST